jgi:ABC-type amino acid transport substrate-binding protein
MLRIPMNEVEALWNEVHPKTWHDFARLLEIHQGAAAHFEDGFIDLMLDETRRYEQTGMAFPDSPEQLAELLNRQLQRMYAQGKAIE